MRRPYLILALVVLFFRLISLDGLALFDPSEGRYAVIAQNMYISGDWVTPFVYDDGAVEPFLGKPPLEFWLISLSYHLFGFTAFAARLPGFLATVLTAFAMWFYASRVFGKNVADLGALLYASSVSVFLFAGSCMLDPLLACTVTLAAVSFALLARTENILERKLYSYLLFICLAAGMLAKGPVALILSGAVVVPWVLYWRRWDCLDKISWVGGLLLFIGIVSPWYLYAEIRSPGFLYYFLVQENVLRYLVKEYGDKYGSGHIYMHGTIWGILFVSFTPWTFYLLNLKLLKQIPTLIKRPFHDADLSYLFLTATVTCAFFTFAKQLTIAYVLPGLPGVALVAALWFERRFQPGSVAQAVHRFVTTYIVYILGGIVFVMTMFTWNIYDNAIALLVCVTVYITSKWLGAHFSSEGEKVPGLGMSAISVAGFLTVGSLSLSPPIDGRMSSRPLITYIHEKAVSDVAFFQRVPQSSYFYDRQLALSARFYPYLPEKMTGVFALTKKQWRRMSEAQKATLEEVESFGTWKVVRGRE